MVYRLVIPVLLFTATVSAMRNFTGPSIKCYVCNSHKDAQGEACNDPINKEVLKPQNCPSGLCYKYIQNIENDIEQINRGCAHDLEPVLKEKEKEEGCALSTGTKLVQVQICNCKSKDGCNGAGEMKSATSVITVSVLLCLIAKLIH